LDYGKTTNEEIKNRKCGEMLKDSVKSLNCVRIVIKYKMEIVNIMNEKFKTENVKVKARKLVTAFPGFYCSENENILFRMG